jgi:hypothetical protein
VTYLLAVLGGVALYFLVILPWRQRREDSVDLGQRLRLAREDESPPREFATTAPPPSPSPPAPEGESVESVLSPAERRALLGDPEEPEPGDDDGLSDPPAWPTEAASPTELEPVAVLHTGDIGLAMMFLLRLQAEGIAYQEMSEVWGSRQIVVPRRHQDDARRILEELRRDVPDERD